ncbi:MAG: HupE/UreJ family protein [Cyanobium sp.]|jgi:urease accessory protein|nr:HupE/UreJ family protein [Synechococcaceae cyanobacterium]
MTPSLSSRSLALFGAASALALWLDQPAQAHGLSHRGLASGFFHPLSGSDHLLLLIAVGAAAASSSPQLLLWALVGAVGGGMFGAMGGSLPALELLAALAVTAVAVLVLRNRHAPQHAPSGAAAGLVAAAVAVHAMLHGLEAPANAAAALWWLGALAASLLVSGGSFLLLRRLPGTWSQGLALLLAIGGGLAALGPVGLLR